MRALAILLLSALAASVPLALGADSATGPLDPDELIRLLGSNDFKLREHATAALGDRAEQVWDKLVRAARSTDPEVRNRAQRAMGEPTRRGLSAILEKSQRDLADAERAFEAETIRTQKLIVETQKIEADAVAQADNLALSIREMVESEERNAAVLKLEESRKAIDALVAKTVGFKEKLETDQKQWRWQRSRLQTRRDQIRYLLSIDEILGRTPPKQWEPALLRVERRLNLRVTFEFIDTPLKEAVAFIGELTQSKIECPEGQDDPPITLRVTDMQAELALEWVGRLADRAVHVDKEAGKAIIDKPRN